MVKSDKEYFKKPKRFPSLKSPSGFLIYSLSDFTIISNILSWWEYDNICSNIRGRFSTFKKTF